MTDIAMAGTFRLADVFGKTFAIYGRRFVPFIILTVLASIPNYIAVFAIGMPDPVTRPHAAFGAANVVLILLQIVTKSLATSAVIYGVVQELRGRAFSVGDSIGVALRRLLPVIGLAVVTTILVVLGMLLLLVPGIILACMWYVSMPVCIAEQDGVFASMSRSRFLTKGYRWQVFGTLLLIAVVTITLEAIIMLAFRSIGQTGLLISLQVFAAVLGSFNGVLISVFYYELRVVKEGVDIEKIAGVFD